MTTSVYFVAPPNYYGNLDYNYELQIEEIKNLNPDKIYCMVETETAGPYIFQYFLKNIEPYLKEYNKEVVIVIANPDGVRISPHVVTSTSSGFALNNHNLIKRVKISKKFFKWDNCDRLFTCYNNNDKFHRYVLIDYLIAHNFLKYGYVTFINPKKTHQELEKNIFQGKYKLKYYNLQKLKDEEDFKLNWPNREEYSPLELPRSYLKGFIDVVAESTYEPNEFFCTEKTCKPIATLKPFICVSNQYYHKWLQDWYGLELYTELFDYSFDEKENVEERIQGVISNMKRLLQLWKNDKNQLIEIYNSIMPKLLSNKQKIYDVITDKDKMLPSKLKFLSTEPVQIYGDTAYNPTVQICRMNGWLLT